MNCPSFLAHIHAPSLWPLSRMILSPEGEMSPDTKKVYSSSSTAEKGTFFDICILRPYKCFCLFSLTDEGHVVDLARLGIVRRGKEPGIKEEKNNANNISCWNKEVLHVPVHVGSPVVVVLFDQVPVVRLHRVDHERLHVLVRKHRGADVETGDLGRGEEVLLAAANTSARQFIRDKTSTVVDLEFAELFYIKCGKLRMFFVRTCIL